MSRNPKEPEAMEWQQEGEEGGDELSRTSASSKETTVTPLSRSHSADQAPRFPASAIGSLAKYRKGRREYGCQTSERAIIPIMHIRNERPDRILGGIDPKPTKSEDEQHLAFNSPPTNVLVIAQELVKVKTQLKSGAQIIGRKVTSIEVWVKILDLESQKVQEGFAAQVAERRGETDNRQARHEGVTSQLHERV